MTFEEYVAEVQRLAEACGATLVGKQYCQPDAWRDSFDDGLSPEEAWSEEASAAAGMLG